MNRELYRLYLLMLNGGKVVRRNHQKVHPQSFLGAGGVEGFVAFTIEDTKGIIHHVILHY